MSEPSSYSCLPSEDETRIPYYWRPATEGTRTGNSGHTIKKAYEQPPNRLNALWAKLKTLLRHTEVLCFHHRNGTDKRRDIPLIKCLKSVIEEIAKCDVLCMNCHTSLHHWERIKRKKVI